MIILKILLNSLHTGVLYVPSATETARTFGIPAKLLNIIIYTIQTHRWFLVLLLLLLKIAAVQAQVGKTKLFINCTAEIILNDRLNCNIFKKHISTEWDILMIFNHLAGIRMALYLCGR